MKALVGAWDHRDIRLVAEITALKTRVAELERELAQARDDNATRRAPADQLEVVLSTH